MITREDLIQNKNLALDKAIGSLSGLQSETLLEMQPEALIIKEIMELLRILTKELLGVQTIQNLH